MAGGASAPSAASDGALGGELGARAQPCGAGTLELERGALQLASDQRRS
jgi:hypothetical protein